MGLAERLGMTLRELGSRMDVGELRLWMARDRIVPPADPWLQAGVVASVVWNTAGKTTKQDRPPSDFVPGRPAEASPEAQSAADLQRFHAFAAAARAKAVGG